MIKTILHTGNIEKAIKDLSSDKNNAISHIYKDAKNGVGPLSEATITLKENYATDDAKATGSSKILDNFYPHYNATIVDKIKSAGGAIVAKTHCDELALGGSGLLSAYGEITNPLDNKRMVGGSSSGAAATLGEYVSIAIGSDTGNSVRLPASYTGIVGFKPSYGAISRYGLFSFASSLDTVAYFAHNVYDIVTTSRVLFGRDDKDMTTVNVELPGYEVVKPKKVAFIYDYGKHNTNVSNAFYGELKNNLEKEGVQVDVVALDEVLLRQIDTVYEIISYSEASSNDSNLTGIIFGKRGKGQSWDDIITNSRTQNLGKMVQRRFTLGSYYLLKDNQIAVFEYAQKVRRVISNKYNKLYDSYDLVIFPTSPKAPLISEGKDTSWIVDYSAVSNLIGNPSISLPWIKDDGMPVGLMLDAKIYNDKSLLRHALWFEEFLGGKND